MELKFNKGVKMERLPISRGFYPFNEDELVNKIKNMLNEVPNTNLNPKGIIVPHAGYRFSGKTAAYAYKTLENKEIDNAVILGVNHFNIGERASLSTRTWRTPLGKIKVNSKISEKILKNELIKKDESSHEKEHSIEVQLPFLKYLNPDIEIAPISLSGDLNFDEINRISETLKDIDYDKNILIASSDLLHIGNQFNLTPNEDNLNYLNREEEKFIDKIKKMDTEEIIKIGRDTTICGYIPIAIAIEVLKDQINEVKILDRSNSYEITGDKSNIVGYVSVALI